MVTHMSASAAVLARSLRRGVRLSLGALLLLPAAATAQLSTSRGWSLGAHLQGTSLTVEGSDASSGGGLGLRLGYGFNRIVTGFVHIDGSEIDVISGSAVSGAWTLAHAEVGARFHFANSLRRWVPYLETSVGGRSVSIEDAVVDGEELGKVSFNGAAFTVGAGLSTFLTRRLALDASMKWTGGEFTEVDVGSLSQRDLDIDAASFRFGVGFIWWPSRR
jgi:opacity protein-like surface antigen